MVKEGCAREPSRGWAAHPNLQQRPHSPNRNQGRLQRTVARAYLAAGTDTLSASTIYDWVFARDRRAARSQARRWSVRRVLLEIAVPVRKVPPQGAWLWRLKSSPVLSQMFPSAE
jgi:GH24 family phage-related lysozyme (muramidase)